MRRFFQKLAVVALTCVVCVYAVTATAQQPAPRGAPRPAPAPAAALGPVVGSIQITGNNRVEQETIRSYLTFREGEALDPLELDKSLKALYATGLFADVVMRREGSGVQIAVKENPIINRIAFEGNRHIEDDPLKAEVQLKARQVFTRAKVQSDVQRILELYRRGGRFAATVEPKIIELEQNRVDLVFEINEGTVTGVRRIAFVGNQRFSDGSLRGVIKTQESAWYRILSSDDRYDPDRVNFDKELLRKYYLSEGFADFRVVSAVAELTPDREGFFLTFTVTEGPRYRFGKVDLVTRFQNLNIKGLRDLIQFKEGDWYNADLVEKTIAKLTEAVGTLGYAFVDVRPNVERDKDKRRINITFDIQEGPRVYVERINITGNTRTLDKVIRREFRLVEGDAFNTAKVRRSQQRLRNLGFFEKVDVSNSAGSAPDRTVIDVNVVEASTGELSFGAGYSSSAGILGDIQLKERNFMGRGQEVRLGLQLGTKSTQVDFGFTEPYFLDRNMSAGFDLFRITRYQQDSSSYDIYSIGGAIRLGYNLGEVTRQTWRYTLRQDQITNVSAGSSAVILSQTGKTVISEIGTQITYDTRDNRLLPTGGYFLRYGIDVAGLGGTEHYIRNRFDAGVYYSIVDDVVLSLIGQVGVIVPISDNLHVANRFFLGGDNLRGFQSGGVGPHSGGDAIGGRYFYAVSTELSFPLGLPKEFGILGKAFLDAGSLWHPEETGAKIKDSSAIRTSAGVGVQWISPFGPIRVDYAVPITREKFDKVENFRFSFGTRF